MSESTQNEQIKNQNVEQNQENKTQKKSKTRTYIVLAVLAIFILGSLITYRAEYIEALEIGEEYVETFMQNVKYKMNIGIINFIVIFIATYITNRFIKKGLKQFFEEEKKPLPRLPNKSLALIIALVSSLIVSQLFLQKVILFVNATQFGITDPVYGLDLGFYMFRGLLIGQLLYYAVTMLILLTVYTVAYYLIVFNKYFEGIDGQTLRNNTFIKQLLTNVMLITIFIASIIFFNMQNMVIDGFLTLNDKIKTTLIRSRCSRSE